MAAFRIAAAQIASVRGGLDANVVAHGRAIAAAAHHGISVVVFPELSLTGYEPELAEELAIEAFDPRLRPLLELVRQHGITAVIGAPLRAAGPRPHLGALLLTTDSPPSAYGKMHLGAGERPFFSPGEDPLSFTSNDHTIGIAICADASQPAHPQSYASAGASIYAAGVFLNAEWYETDAPRLAAYAARFRLLVVMANHGASVGTFESVGRSAIWGPDGRLLVQARGSEDCLVIAERGDSDWLGSVVCI